jgi:hypothetical protein
VKLLLITQGEYGDRMVANITGHARGDWTIETWRAPKALPPIIDEPEDFLPEDMPAVDLVVSFGEHAGVAELLPDIVARTGAKAVLVPIDSEVWVPTGLANQLARLFEERGIGTAFPKPLCSLTEDTYGFPKRVRYEAPLISEFARCFGAPRFETEGTEEGVSAVRVVRDATCGCARHVAEGLVGVRPEDAEFEAGMLHHHYPCLATMGIDPQLGDTLMHVSGIIMKNEVADGVKPFKKPGTAFKPR